MKKVLIVVLISVIACSHNAHADDFSITIDAEMDAWYYNLIGPENGLVFMPAACHLLDIGDGRGPDDDADCSAIVWFSYDPNYLYCYLEVKDDAAGVFSGTRYLNDCIELKFDPEPDKGVASGACDLRLTVKDREDAENPNGVDNLNGSNRMRDLKGNPWEPTEDDYARRLTDNGYALEFRVPLDCINATDGRSLQNNQTGTFGLAINIADNDTGTRTDMLQWSAGHADAAWNTPVLLGSATFIENHILKLEAVSPIDPSIVNENADDWYSNPNVTAWALSPADGSTEVPRDIVLRWMMGKDAVAHDVYLGTDFNNVNDANSTNPLDVLAAQGLQTNSYTPDELLGYGQTYYWRVDKIGAAPESEVIKGDVQGFTVLNFPVVIDDFEDYNDFEPDTVWNTWADGYDDPANGSSAGYPEPDFFNDEHYLEDEIVHGGDWSMPLFYDNSSAMLSEVTRTLNADWTQEGVVTLTLFYHGDAANAAEPMYVALDDNAVVTNDDANAALVTEWTRWDIPLQSFADQGVNLANVNTMSIGFGNKANLVIGGSGHVFFDNIRLYLPEP